jgi:hypothetical protein
VSLNRRRNAMKTSDGKAAYENEIVGKKRYASPKLVVYGRLEKITQSAGVTGMGDGGGGTMSKTGL